MMVNRFRRQQTHQMPHQNKNDAHMKKIAGHAHIAVTQHLAGPGFPGVLFTIEPNPTAHQTDGDGNVGI
jgi:hypothetical protein